MARELATNRTLATHRVLASSRALASNRVIISDAVPAYATGEIIFTGVPDGAYAFATGTISLSTPCVDGDTLTINGAVFTFRASPVGDYEILVRDTAEKQSISIKNVLTASTDPLVSVATYAHAEGDSFVTATYNTAGAAGNAFTLATNSSAISLSGATLEGGAGAYLIVGAVTIWIWDGMGDTPPTPYVNISNYDPPDEITVATQVEGAINDNTADAGCSAVQNDDGTVTLTSLVVGEAGNDIPLSENATNCTVVPFSGGS